MLIQIQGLQIVFYILTLVGIVYIGLVLFSMYSKYDESEKLKDIVGFYKKPKLHIILMLVILTLIIFRPIKLQTQTDANRTANRHSFDVPVYKADPQANGVTVSREKYSMKTIQEEKEKSQDEWDKMRNSQ